MSGSPLIVALDQDDPGEARACVTDLEEATRYKVGSVLFTRAGPAFVRDLVERGLGVFLDLKLHDTPATVAGAATAAAELEVEMLTVHAAGGPAMIAAARAAAERATASPSILAVTVLTSLDPAAWELVAGPGGRSIPDAVAALGAMAVEAGADGLVCSAAEVARLREELGPGPLLVVPGIRPAWSTSDHAGQARTAEPAAALAAGASHLVLGRAVTADPDPRAAFGRIAAEIVSRDP
ncbi:MAG TPA: orotidine-5'-phosphate decarboxylase [Gemmatimonadota bacterium]|nr:orotidine-5'-phosphate decarboxylase [Gemmatimonadota bacterium]